MPLTGEPAEALLKHILFDLNQAPRGIFADRAEANQKLVTEIQKTLLGLGFFRGALSGRMDVGPPARSRTSKGTGACRSRAG